MTFTPGEHAAGVINECLSDDYDDYVAFAKAKYYYENVEPSAKEYENQMLYRGSAADHVSSLLSKYIFFPAFVLRRDAGEVETVSLFTFCVCCEILSVLKRLLPPELKKKIKAVGTIERDTVALDEELPNAITNCVRCAQAGLFRLKWLNKVFLFSNDGEPHRLISLNDNAIEFKRVDKPYVTN